MSFTNLRDTPLLKLLSGELSVGSQEDVLSWKTAVYTEREDSPWTSKNR